MDHFHFFAPNDILQVQKHLLSWYSVHKRKLPWRNDSIKKNAQFMAYHTLVSEVMLQQTQISTVIPYYERWMERWSNLKSLSNACYEDVQEAWKGLGYYSRARRLLLLAKTITEGNGEMPNSVNELMRLPGIGRYTAGMIASIAFDRKAAAVDGNVMRVLSRLRAIGAPIESSTALKTIWDLAESLVPGKGSGDWNQALIELGATVCSPRKPSCVICPLQKFCHAYNQQMHDIEDCDLCLAPSDAIIKPTPLNYPRKIKKKAPHQRTEVACIISCFSNKEEFFFLVKRDSLGLLADLWQFPSFETTTKSNILSVGTKSLKKYCSVKGILKSRYIGSVDHKFSHISMTYEIIHVALKKECKLKLPKGCCDQAWLSKHQLKSQAISTAMMKVFNKFLQNCEVKKKR